jgi:pimeloyl-ACP methyl ester carboxylesterase
LTATAGEKVAARKPLLELFTEAELAPLDSVDVASADRQAVAAAAAERIAQLCDVLSRRFDRFHVIGHSMGGAIAVSFAATYPTKVKSLTLLAPAGYFDKPPAVKMFGSLAAFLSTPLRHLVFSTQDSIVDELNKDFTETFLAELPAPQTTTEETILNNLKKSTGNMEDLSNRVMYKEIRMALAKDNPQFASALLETADDFSQLFDASAEARTVVSNSIPLKIMFGNQDETTKYEVSVETIKKIYGIEKQMWPEDGLVPGHPTLRELVVFRDQKHCFYIELWRPVGEYIVTFLKSVDSL